MPSDRPISTRDVAEIETPQQGQNVTAAGEINQSAEEHKTRAELHTVLDVRELQGDLKVTSLAY